MKTRRATALLILVLAGFTLACSSAESENPAENGATAEVGQLTPDQLLSAPPANALILDVRTSQEFASGHVPGAINLPHTEIATRLAEVGDDRERPIVVYCERGGRASKAEAELLAAGFTRVLHLEGDMQDWRAKGRPLAHP